MLKEIKTDKIEIHGKECFRIKFVFQKGSIYASFYKGDSIKRVFSSLTNLVYGFLEGYYEDV